MDKTAGRSRRESRRAVLRSLLTRAILLAAYYLLPLDSAFTTETVLGLVGGIAGAGRPGRDHRSGSRRPRPGRRRCPCPSSRPLPELVFRDPAVAVLDEHADTVDLHVVGGVVPVLEHLRRLVGEVLVGKVLVGKVLVGEEREDQLLLVRGALFPVLAGGWLLPG
ncbi:hypothetical protein [Streptomyces sp. NPDC051577]|uniref:hypothetical protein n=1 Tax=Streptomyces sp. NPDC051577 TaxID=3155166 RepID=UPI003445138B